MCDKFLKKLVARSTSISTNQQVGGWLQSKLGVKMTHVQQWVRLVEVSEYDAIEALEMFSSICSDHEIDSDTTDALWAASQLVLSYLLKENGELPDRNSVFDEPSDC